MNAVVIDPELIERCMQAAVEYVKAVALERGVQIEQMSPDEDLGKYGIDSYETLRLVMAVEEAGGFSLSDEDLNMYELHNLKNLRECILDNLGKSRTAAS